MQLDEAKKLGLVSPDICSRSAAMLLVGSVQGLVIQAMLSGRVGDIGAGAEGVFAVWRRGVSAT